MKLIYFEMNGRNSFSSSSVNQRNIEALELFFCVGHTFVIVISSSININIVLCYTNWFQYKYFV
uniref:Uncharacterized protein n=1 Tax=Cannabis sativa TaxID=3483 RepID=A0A803QWA7_CANSA